MKHGELRAVSRLTGGLLFPVTLYPRQIQAEVAVVSVFLEYLNKAGCLPPSEVCHPNKAESLGIEPGKRYDWTFPALL
eukprot:1148718-Pelagomonas_calceolata.AAC.1